MRVRPIRPDDARRLQAFATRLSPRTIFLRTNMVRPASLTDAEAAYATQVDYRSSMALVALTGTEPDDQIVAVARYVSMQPSAWQAEVGIVVEDAYQDHGLGSELLLRLVEYARDHGIQSLLGNIAVDNGAVQSMLRRTGLRAEYIDGGRHECQVVVALKQRAAARPLTARAGEIVRPLLRLAWNAGAGFTKS